jgi:5-methylthioribose kinase
MSATPSVSESVWLTRDSLPEVDRLLRRLSDLAPEERIVDMQPAGEGNMNLTLRVRTTSGSCIVKQARPWVQKYPQIAAPVDRIHHEIRFYEVAARMPAVAGGLPKLIGALPEDYVMVLEDLGPARDCAHWYNDPPDQAAIAEQLCPLVDWLTELHRTPVSALSPGDFANRNLRRLNHEHMFVIPFRLPTAIDLDHITPGLGQIAAEVCAEIAVVNRCQELGQLYLAEGQTLLHGDFFPGSWLITPAGVKTIDPEFCYLGRPEFDLAVFTAHVRLLGVSEATMHRLLARYRSAGTTIDRQLVNQWAAVEILRRLLGVAQLPDNATLDVKRQHIAWSLQQLRGA